MHISLMGHNLNILYVFEYLYILYLCDFSVFYSNVCICRAGRIRLLPYALRLDYYAPITPRRGSTNLMNDIFHRVFNPGFLEVYYGPMKSGKTRTLLNRLDSLSYLSNCPMVIVKPHSDNRDQDVRSRFGEVHLPCKIIPADRPSRILDLVTDSRVLAIDEAQFFIPGHGLLKIVQECRMRGMNVLVSGLNLDFRGEPFGEMPLLINQADVAYPLHAVCDYPGCNNAAFYTQRLIAGAPAPYDAPIVSVEGAQKNETYEVRCLWHHKVPGKP